MTLCQVQFIQYLAKCMDVKTIPEMIFFCVEWTLELTLSVFLMASQEIVLIDH